jgi:polysaccharide export outer membrane protein
MGLFRTKALTLLIIVPVLIACVPGVLAQTPERSQGQTVRTAIPSSQEEEFRSTYVLGPEDQVTLKVLDIEEIGTTPLRVDPEGNIRCPYVGRVHAGGLTVDQLQAEVTARLKTYVHEPDVTVAVAEYRSQPVSVLGAVRNPGIHQLQGRKTLAEILSLAGGLDTAAGPAVKITRRAEWGKIPLRNAWEDPSGQFNVAQVSVAAILDAQRPEENILIRPYDVISVPRAGMIYVSGQVMKPGGFVLNERERISVLEALALAGGADRMAATQHSLILRRTSASPDRVEIPVDVRALLQGKGEDIALVPDDILFVPDNQAKRVTIRAIEAAVQTATGVVIWRR